MDDKIKKCDSCGRLLPIEQFQSWINKDGSVRYLHQCYKCQRDKANKRYSDKKKFGEIAKFADEDLIKEIERRRLFALKHIPSHELILELKSRRRE